ncbi:hypothetical protein DBR43_02315 [Pedobacter sp. KBW06]|nr:hypothetical protein DBR43_02315 [Pedobacter sp. KBW06]
MIKVQLIYTTTSGVEEVITDTEWALFRTKQPNGGLWQSSISGTLAAGKLYGKIGMKMLVSAPAGPQARYSNTKFDLIGPPVDPVDPGTPSVPGIFPIDGVTGPTSSGPNGTIGIYSWGIKPGGSHFLNQHQSTSNNYYVFEGRQFYAFSSQTPGTVPIHRLQAYYSDNTRTNFYSTGTSGEGFFQYVGIAFYAFTTQVPGTVPIYCYTNQQGRDHYFTTGINHPYWVQKHIAFYAYPNNWQG